jgi:hypothetical protein
MWSAGQITADAVFWQEGMSEWEPIDALGLDLAIQPISLPVASVPVQPTRLPSHHVHHTGKVTTKASGSGIVALGSIMCIVGVFLIFTSIAAVGGILLFVGFFVAVIGRMMS